MLTKVASYGMTRMIRGRISGRMFMLGLLLVFAGSPGAQARQSDVVQAELSSPDQTVDSIIRNRLQAGRTTGLLVVDGVPVRARNALPTFYEARAFRPAWVERNQGVPVRLTDLIEAVRSVREHGLDPSDYHLERLVEWSDALRTGGSLDDMRLVDLDMLATDAFLVLASHLHHGRVNPELLEPEWLANRRNERYDVVLEEALASGRIAAALSRLAPRQPRYARLKSALARQRMLAASGEWTPIPSGDKLENGIENPRVPLVRRRLVQLGDLEASAADSSAAFDEALEQAVMRFQRRSGLDADGVIGPATLSALNRTPADRIRQITVNMERWRWLPDDLGVEHIEVNIPGFSVQVVRDGRIVREHRAVVGRQVRQTPSFSGRMTYLVLAPYWHVPPTIAAVDKFPEIRNNPGYVAAQRMTLLSASDNRPVDPASVDFSQMTGREFNSRFRLRQEPGPHNALGRVKFMFPNRHNVYLHDTPSRELFDRSSRGFSSGCIRVQNPMELAEWLLRDHPDWPPARIRAVAEGSVETAVILPEPIPVHLLYWTAWADPDGVIHFREDIYSRDDRVWTALTDDPPGP